MTEMATPENDALVSSVYTQALHTRSEGRELAPPDRVVYEIEMLSQEVNSGASFEQYFRWASIDEISQVIRRLESLGLPEVADLTRRAIAVAFPGGIPSSDERKDELTDWTEDQEEQLSAFAETFAESNGRIINELAALYRRSGDGA